MGVVKGGISGILINIEQGDITKQKCDAYVVPQFASGISEGGVGGAILRAGAEQGMTAYGQYLNQHKGNLEFGDGCITTSGGGNSKYLIHIASIGSGRSNEYSTIQKAMFNALAIAIKRGVKTIAVPALGTGIIGGLMPSQSAKAMLSSVFEFAKRNTELHQITFVINGPKENFEQFAEVLRSQSYKSASEESGEKSLDLSKWAAEVHKDLQANRNFKQRN